MDLIKQKKTSIIIRPLEYFEVIPQPGHIGGYASAKTYVNTYATGNTAYASAGAIATGALSIAKTKTHTKVTAGRFFTIGISYGVAYAVAYDGFNADASASASVDVGITKNY